MSIGHRKGGVGGVEAAQSQIPFQNHFFSFPSRLCFKTGKLLAFEKYPFPICYTAAPVVITLPLLAALLELR